MCNIFESETEYGEPQIWIYLNDGTSIEITHEEYGIIKDLNEIENADIIISVYTPENIGQTGSGANEIIVINKSDTVVTSDCANAIYTSARTGDGMQDLMNIIRQKIHEMFTILAKRRQHG